MSKLLGTHSVESRDALAAALLASRTVVPERGNGRTSDHTEAWVLAHLLSTLSDAGELSFPLRLTKGERPDYVMSSAFSEWGIEISELVPPALAHAVEIRNREFPDAPIDTSLFRSGVSPRPRDEVRSLLRDRASGFGWEGDSVEREWAAACGLQAERKWKKFAEPGYSVCSENWLLLYDNMPGPALSLDTAADLDLVQQSLRLCFNSQLAFSRVVVLCHTRLVEFQMDARRVLDVVLPWPAA